MSDTENPNDNAFIEEEPQSKYMSQAKMRYYLASVDENIEVLRKEQINDLTTVLIGLKSEYDGLVRESNMIRKETQNICKKIDLLERMDNKTKEKTNELNSKNTTIKEAIVVKKKELAEEQYNKKTLLGLIEKIKNDILINTKEVSDAEDTQQKLKHKYQKEKLFENDIKEKYNSVYSRIAQQKNKNNFDKNEYELQLQYYQTIIEQKWMFIQSADERKERQRKIAQEAKNDSQDKQEIDKRHILHMLYLFDKYLKSKMEIKLKENTQIEEVFQKISTICGTANLKVMVDKIIMKDKRYNYSVSKVTEKEKMKKRLQSEIQVLEKDFEELKCQVVVDEDTVNDKNIQTIKVYNPEDRNEDLIEKGIALNDNYKELQEIHKEIVLKYEQVVSNIKKLIGTSKTSDKELISSSSINNINNPQLSPSKDEQLNQSNMQPSHLNESSNFNNNSNIFIDEETLVANYNEFLTNAEKRVDEITSNSREDFIERMRDKRKEEQSEGFVKTKNKLEELKKQMNLSSTRKSSAKETNVDEYDYHGNEEHGVIAEEKKLQDEIFNSYMNGIKMIRENYIYNEKEKEKKKKELQH